MKNRKKLKVKSLLQTSTLLGLIVFTGGGCSNEDAMEGASPSKNSFFEYQGQNDFTRQVLSILEMKNDSSSFVDAFVDKYGYPMWKSAVDVYEGDKASLFVPVRKQGKKEIGSIWVFNADSQKLIYGMMNRPKVPNDLFWTFDYFTQNALHTKPSNGVIIKPVADTTIVNTRATIVTIHCNDIYTGTAGQELEYQETDCWTTSTWIPDFPTGHGNDPGSGGITGPLHWKMSDYSGGGGSTPTTTAGSPCDEVHKQLQDSTMSNFIKNSLDYLKKTPAKNQREGGFAKTTGNTYVSLTPNGSTSLNFNPDNNMTDYCHYHTMDYIDDFGKYHNVIQMFSPADLITFLKMVQNTLHNGAQPGKISGTVVTKNGTYVLRFTGNPKDISNLPSPNQLYNDYVEYFTSKYSSNAVEAFLHFIQDKIHIKGITLMTIDLRGTTSTATLNAVGTGVQYVDC